MSELTTEIPESLPDVEARVRVALATEGFGVLSEIDVAATLRAKLGVERPALKVLGACNPTLVDQALTRDPRVALALPCNVALEEVGATTTRVSIADPALMMSDPRLGDLVAEARERLARVLGALAP